jgi:hypothetical protein
MMWYEVSTMNPSVSCSSDLKRFNSSAVLVRFLVVYHLCLTSCSTSHLISAKLVSCSQQNSCHILHSARLITFCHLFSSGLAYHFFTADVHPRLLRAFN